MILVTAANATSGKEVIKQLAAQGVAVRGMARDLTKAETLKADFPELELIAGDLAQPDTLDAPLQGVDKVFLVAAGDPAIVEWHKNLVEVAKRAGVKHIVKLSSMGAGLNSPVQAGRWHGASQQVIEESGIAFTFLQPNSFMQNLVTNSAQSIAYQGAFYAPRGQGKVSMVDARDIARVAVAALTQEGHAGKTYVLTGPQALTFYEAAEKLSATLGKTVNYVDIPPEEYCKALISYGLSDWLAEDLTDLEQLFSRGGGEYVFDDIATVTGQPATTFDQFARDYASAFKA